MECPHCGKLQADNGEASPLCSYCGEPFEISLPDGPLTGDDADRADTPAQPPVDDPPDIDATPVDDVASADGKAATGHDLAGDGANGGTKFDGIGHEAAPIDENPPDANHGQSSSQDEARLAPSGARMDNLDKIIRAQDDPATCIVTVVGFANSGKTWLLRRILKLALEGKLNGRDRVTWSVEYDLQLRDAYLDRQQSDPDTVPPLQEGEIVGNTDPGAWFVHELNAPDQDAGKHSAKNYLLVDIAGEDFSSLFDRVFSISPDSQSRHMIALLAASDAFVFVVPADILALEPDFNTRPSDADRSGQGSPEKEDPEEEDPEEKRAKAIHSKLREHESTFTNIANAIAHCRTRSANLENGVAGMMERGITASDLDDKSLKKLRRVDLPIMLLMSQADQLEKLLHRKQKHEYGETYDLDPVEFSRTSISTIVNVIQQRFSDFRIDFVTAFDEFSMNGEKPTEDTVFYSTEHYGVDPAFHWLREQLESKNGAASKGLGYFGRGRALTAFHRRFSGSRFRDLFF